MAFNYGNYPAFNPGYNPVQPYQNPGMNLQPQMPISSQQAPQAVQQMGQGISPASRPVSNREEAVAAQIPFDGSISVFTDTKHNRIYTKMFNFSDGSSVFKTYVLENSDGENEKNESNQNFATKQDLDIMRQEIDDIKEKLEEAKKAPAKKQ